MTAFRLALTNLAHDRVRSTVSVVGAGFAVVLIFMQLGFLGALNNTATLLLERLEFDLLITSTEYLDMSRPGKVRRDRLAEARTVPGVVDVVPLTTTHALWKNPTADPVRGGRRWPITMIAVDPGKLDRTFRPEGGGIFRSQEDYTMHKAALERVGIVLLDRRSRPDFGKVYDPDHPNALGAMKPGTTTEVNGQQVELGGYFEIGTGFSYAGLLLVSEETYHSLSGQPSDHVSFGLVKLAPGEDPDTAAARMRKTLPRDVQVFTREGIYEQERTFWISKTAVGTFFFFGVLLALFVGAIFVYQMMVADIKKHLPEYATLKAMGYPFSYLFRVVVWQAVLLALGGYIFGLVVSLPLYELTKTAANFPMAMTLDRLAFVLALSIGMCVGSGLVAVRKVRTADPADLF